MQPSSNRSLVVRYGMLILGYDSSNSSPDFAYSLLDGLMKHPRAELSRDAHRISAPLMARFLSTC